MKKLSLLLAAALLMLSFSGCKGTEDNHFHFYYLRTSDTISFGQSDALVAPVSRQISGQSSDLTYLLQLYFEGPSEEGFESPFPGGTRLFSARLEGKLLILEVSEPFSQLENIQLALAGACLTATCQELAGVETVQVLCAEESYQFYRSDYTFLDVIDTQSGKDTQ